MNYHIAKFLIFELYAPKVFFGNKKARYEPEVITKGVSNTSTFLLINYSINNNVTTIVRFPVGSFYQT